MEKRMRGVINLDTLTDEKAFPQREVFLLDLTMRIYKV